MKHREFSVVTVSSSRKELTDDKSGDTIELMLKTVFKDSIISREIVTDNVEKIKEVLIKNIEKKSELIITTGGTGVTKDDVTPEATLQVIDREIPGIIISLMVPFLNKVPTSAISRARCGIKNETLIINLPGSPKACREQMDILLKYLEHCLDKIKGDKTPCGE